MGKRLSHVERMVIETGVRRGMTFQEIAKDLKRATSTVSREVARNGGARGYVPARAQQRARCLARRPRTRKLVANPQLAAAVEAGLLRGWSPQQIAGRLRLEHPGDARWHISHETIYQALFVQGRGGLRAELITALRSGRTRRRPQRRGVKRGASSIKGMVMITQRPAEARDRAVPGHWEGDLLIGADKRSQVGTLVERTSRYLMLVHLPESRRADVVADALADTIRTLPAHLTKSLTWDQGGEMARHAQFSIATGVQVYFCDPHSPWQKGTVENTNGLLRQYLPKGMDLSTLTAQDLEAIAAQLNSRPRKTLGYLTPAEKLSTALLATTT